MTRLALMLTALTVLFASSAAAETPDEVYSFARHLKKDGMLEAAAQQFLRFARENPTDMRAPDALFNAADCLADSDSNEQAISVLETIASTYPDHPDLCRYQVQLGRLLYKTEQFEEADQVFTRVVVTMPDCALVPDALLGKGEALISLGRFGTAAEVLRNLLDNYIESAAAPRATYDLAFCYRRSDRTDEALRTYENLVVQFPGDPLAGFAALEAARMHAEKGETDRAVEYYSRARSFGTKTFAVPAGMEGAELLQATGKPGEALRWYQELLARTDVEDRRALFIKAVSAAYDAGDYNSVRNLSDAYAQAFPGTFSPQVTFTSARAALKTSRYDEAIESAAKLEAFAPGTEWARSASRLRGDAMLGKGQPRAAVDEFRNFVSASGDSAARCEVLRDIANISFSVTRDTTVALDALRQMLDVEQWRFPGEIFTVASSNERSGRYQQARSFYDDLIRRFPLSDEAEQAAGRVAYLDEFAVTDYGAATAAMDRAAYQIATGPQDQALLRLLDARIRVSKNFDGALAMCEQLKKSDKGKAAYPDVLYYEGLAWDKLARRAAASATGAEGKAAREYAKKADRPWDELASKYPQAAHAPSAAFAQVIMHAEVEGTIDVKAALAVLAAYPGHPESRDLIERLGDYYYAQSSKEDLERSVAYYSNAIAIDGKDLPLQYKQGLALARQGNVKSALEVFERLARTGESRTALKASYEAGRTLRQLKDYRAALPYFDRVAAADPSGAFGSNAALQAADCVYLQGDYDGAIDRYEAALAGAPTPLRRWEVTHRIALCLRQAGRYDESFQNLMDCVLSDLGGKQRARVFEDAAEVAGLRGDIRAQAIVLEAYVDEFGTSEGAYGAAKELVRLHLRLGEADAAFALADRLTREAPKDDLEPRALRAMALYRQGKSGEARRERDAVAKTLGEDSAIVREIGIEAARYQYDNRQYQAAVESIRPFAESCKGEGVCEEARYLFAMSMLAANDLDHGTSAAQGFFRDYPLSKDGPMLHLRMGNVLATANRTGESLLHYQEAAETASDSSVAYLALKNLGVSYQKLKRWGEAEQVWSRMLKRFPDTNYASEAALNVARCKMEQGDYRNAIAAYEDALPLLDTESKARAFYWMGTSYEQLGDYQSAVVEYLKVPYLASSGGMWVVTAQLKAAECYVKINRGDAARDIYTKVIRNHGATSNWGKIAQKGLDGLNQAAQSDPGGGSQ